MKRFYFTFVGDGSQPYENGWIEILARDIKQAAYVFRKIYPNPLDDEYLNCADYFTEEQFWKSKKCNENFEERCHVFIAVHDFINDNPQIFSLFTFD